MAELIPEDRENYENLKTAFAKLNYPGDKIQAITQSVNTELKKNLDNDTIELRKRVDLVDGYLKIHAVLLPDKSADVQEVLNLNNQLNRSLKVVEGETLDLTNEIESVYSDSLFLEFLEDEQLKKMTEALLSDRDPNLHEQDINKLIQAWGKAVQKFVDDARKKGGKDDRVTPGKPETFAHFFGIQNELETLYSRLADTDTVQRTR
jgi:hypothetical protein